MGHRISGYTPLDYARLHGVLRGHPLVDEHGAASALYLGRLRPEFPGTASSEERRVGKECVRPCRSRGSTSHLKKKGHASITTTHVPTTQTTYVSTRNTT